MTVNIEPLIYLLGGASLIILAVIINENGGIRLLKIWLGLEKEAEIVQKNNRYPVHESVEFYFTHPTKGIVRAMGVIEKENDKMEILGQEGKNLFETRWDKAPIYLKNMRSIMKKGAYKGMRFYFQVNDSTGMSSTNNELFALHAALENKDETIARLAAPVDDQLLHRAKIKGEINTESNKGRPLIRQYIKKPVPQQEQQVEDQEQM